MKSAKIPHGNLKSHNSRTYSVENRLESVDDESIALVDGNERGSSGLGNEKTVGRKLGGDNIAVKLLQHGQRSLKHTPRT